MKTNKLYSVLSSLTGREFLQFGWFVRSPFFNQSEILIKFYDYLSAFYPDFDDNKLTKHAVFEALYTGEQFSETKIRDRYAHMLKLVREFLAYIDYNDDNLEFRKNLIAQYHKRELFGFITAELGDISESVEGARIRDENYYLNKYMMEVVKRKFDPDKHSFDKDAILRSNVTTEIDHIIHFFLIVMLKEYSRMFNIQDTIKTDHKWKFFEEIMSYLSREKHSYEKVILVNLLYRFLLLHRTEADESEIYELKKLLDDNEVSLEKEVFNIFYVELYNYCKKKQSRGDKNFGHLSFELIKEMLEKNVLLEEDETMLSHTYINITASGLRDGHLEWAEDFINRYRYKVAPDDRENAYNYNYAVLCYMKGYGKDLDIKRINYDAALNYLAKVKSEDFYFATRIRNHELKIYYELGHLESALSLIDTYHHYLSRNELIPIDLAERYFNFITFLKRLLFIKSNENNSGYPSLPVLKKELSQNVKTEFKGWMLDMIEELEESTTNKPLKS